MCLGCFGEMSFAIALIGQRCKKDKCKETHSTVGKRFFAFLLPSKRRTEITCKYLFKEQAVAEMYTKDPFADNERVG